jgi:3-hydroxybutyryl-CoA dehydrogenase
MVQAGHKGVKSGQGFYMYTTGNKEFKPSTRFQKV